MKDDRIYKALNIIVGLLSDLHGISHNNYDYVNGKWVCLECKEEWYSENHRKSKCKSYKLSSLCEIALSFDE